MIRITFCLIRRPSLSQAEFLSYWHDRHAPLVLSVKDVIHMRRYVQLHSLPPEASAPLRESRGGPPGYDGIAEAWYDSFEDLAKTREDPAAAEAGRLLLEDEMKFIDLTKSPIWWGEEKVILPGTGWQ